MALTKEEAERRWLAKRSKGRQSEDLVVKQRKAAEEAAKRQQQNQEAATKYRKAKEELARKQRELHEVHRQVDLHKEFEQPQPTARLGTLTARDGEGAVLAQEVDPAAPDGEGAVLAREVDLGAVPDMEELIGSIDRMDFFDLGAVNGDDSNEQLPELQLPSQEVVSKPEEDIFTMEERRARLFAKARARRLAWDEKLKEVVTDLQVSAIARQLRPQHAPLTPSPKQQKPKTAVIMPRRMKIGGNVAFEAVQPVHMPSSGLSLGGLVAPLTAQAAAFSACPPPRLRETPASSSRVPAETVQEVSRTAGFEEHCVDVLVKSDDAKHMSLEARRKEAVPALERGVLELEELDKDLRACRDVVLAALQVDGHALAQASAELRDDREVVLAAVCESGLALRHAGELPRRDREVVLAAVLESGAALEFASHRLRSDGEVVLNAVENDADAVRFAAESLMDDRSFVIDAARVASRTFQYASARLKQDKEVVLAALESNPDAFMHAGPQLRSDRDFVLAAVQVSGCAIAHASPELRKDAEVLAVAVKSDPLAAASIQE
mmetsp:Transcript_83323/g.193595  ORF Transcript_83323/g.193595 Transcript_83323/m.193595 type:complete len:551 (-) Transcript_83323:90-1742(-)|eukprot:CAMPEP_0171100742 /NCGR_PEP_ID=MMETSP0766_2-20121228/53130_1 /TAXON_ID=439317 /ORGANISM="Gambierdiscus australes, Strain CAWD 149" /LENGTH=550 /DNA_ID=CAMNT_0011560615 /DNA_START=120 /DNA_END=1772 /DNA_ORIENTATION=+